MTKSWKKAFVYADLVVFGGRFHWHGVRPQLQRVRNIEIYLRDVNGRLFPRPFHLG